MSLRPTMMARIEQPFVIAIGKEVGKHGFGALTWSNLLFRYCCEKSNILREDTQGSSPKCNIKKAFI